MGRPRKTGHELPKRVYPCPGGFRYFPKGGKPIWLGSTLVAALRKHESIVGRPTGYPTMNALFDRYLRDVTAKRKSAATQRDDRRAMPYLRAFMGEMDPHEVDASTGYDYLETRGAVAPVRANREFAVARHAMTKAVRWKIVPANPFYRLEKNPETPRDREVRPEEVLAWYRVAGPMLGAYTCLKLLIGLRKADMLRLKTEDWTHEGLFSPAQKNGKRFLFERSRALCRAVERCLARLPRRDTGLLFCTRTGDPYVDDGGNTSGFDSIWQRRMVRFAAAGCDRFTEHDLRSKAGDDAEEAGQRGHRLLGNTEAQFRRAYQRRTQRVQPVR